jgi:hypothetical protein
MVHAISGQSPLKTTPKSAGLALVLLWAGVPGAADPPPRFAGPLDAGLMAAPRSREASGLAASRRTDGLLWTLADSGEPVLFALGADGSARGAVRLVGVVNEDWEDVAAFELDGRAWLLVADCGDNFARRSRGVLHLLEEPPAAALKPGGELPVDRAYSIPFIYEDGARDCEAVAVDPAGRAVYLLTKREYPAQLYRLPLRPATTEMPAVARRVGPVPGLPQPAGLRKIIQAPAFAHRGRPTAMDFSADGTLALVLTYGDLLVFPRATGEMWPQALARAPRRLPAHLLPQAEAACFTRDGRRIFLCSEKSLRLLRYERRD